MYRSLHQLNVPHCTWTVIISVNCSHTLIHSSTHLYATPKINSPYSINSTAPNEGGAKQDTILPHHRSCGNPTHSTKTNAHSCRLFPAAPFYHIEELAVLTVLRERQPIELFCVALSERWESSVVADPCYRFTGIGELYSVLLSKSSWRLGWECASVQFILWSCPEC
jgi:hypothetical protein